MLHCACVVWRKRANPLYESVPSKKDAPCCTTVSMKCFAITIVLISLVALAALLLAVLPVIKTFMSIEPFEIETKQLKQLQQLEDLQSKYEELVRKVSGFVQILRNLYKPILQISWCHFTAVTSFSLDNDSKLIIEILNTFARDSFT